MTLSPHESVEQKNGDWTPLSRLAALHVIQETELIKLMNSADCTESYLCWQHTWPSVSVNKVSVGRKHIQQAELEERLTRILSVGRECPHTYDAR
jgi:hypothetical protein